MNNVIFELERENKKILDPRETDTKEIVKTIDPIQVKGQYEKINEIEKDLLNRVYLSLCMLNIDSIEALSQSNKSSKSNLVKNFSNNYLFPISKIDQGFIKNLKNKYPLIEASNFSLESLFADSVCQIFTQAYLKIISWVLISFWRFKKEAKWEDISYILNLEENPLIEFKGFIFLEKNSDSLVLMFSERNDGMISKLKEIHIDNKSIKTFFTHFENLTFDLRKHDFNAVKTFLDNVLQKRDKKLSNFYCFFWTQKPFEGQEFEEIHCKKTGKSSNPDSPMLDFIGNLLNNTWNKYKNVKINEVNSINLNLDIDFDIFAKKEKSEDFFILELKQSYDIEKATGLKELITFCGRILYLSNILEEKYKKEVEITAYFVSTVQINSDDIDLNEHIKVNLIDESNLGDLFLLEQL